MLARAVPICVRDQTIEEWVGVHTDVDTAVRAQVAMREAKEAAEAASKLKGEFLANVSHEIRTPMNAILGMTELTLNTELQPDQRENLQVIRSAADSLLSVINDVLDFSKIEAGKLELDPVDFHLRSHIHDLLSLLSPRADAKGLELLCRVRPEVPDQLVGDPARLRQIVANLVGNAIKFTERGEILVDVGIDVATPDVDGIVLHFQVSDTGIGVPIDKRESIFAPFTQADGSTTRLYGGTGLGLAISLQLVGLMGGKVWLESEVGRGSNFHFTAQFFLSPASRTDEDVCPEQSLAGLAVLVVDDNAVNRQILHEVLTQWEMKPTLAAGGREALVLLEEARRSNTPFAISLVDAMMPEMDGLTLSECVWADPGPAGTVLLMLTSNDRQRFAGLLQSIGIGAYLSKPINQFELETAILGALGKATRSTLRHGNAAVAPSVKSRALRILMAEDNAFNQKVAGLMLSRLGHSVTVVNNGREALASPRAAAI